MEKDGTITRKELIEDEALNVWSVYADNVEVAIDKNNELIGNIKKINGIIKEMRNAKNNIQYVPIRKEVIDGFKEINRLVKERNLAELKSEKFKQQEIKTQKELLKLAQEQVKLASLKAQKETAAERELEKIKQDRIKTEKELIRIKQENERLTKLQFQTEQTNTKEVERLKRELIRTEREAIKLKQDKIRLEKQEADQVKRKTTLTMEERVQQQLANKAEKEAVLAKMGLIGAYQKLNKQRTEAKKRLQDLIASGSASNKQIRQAQREFDLLDKKVRQAEKAAGDFSKTVGNYKTAFSGMSNVLGAFGIVGGVTGLVTLGKSIYETTKQIQAQDIALRMLSETEAVYAKNKDFLIRISEQYGLELLTTTNAYKNYFASAKTSIEEGKISFNEMQMIFEKVSKSASMLGLSVEQQEGAFLAISQMMSKGTVQSEELRGQLGERLPGAFEVMAKALGVTTMELGDMLKKGEVLAADVLPKFAIAYEKAIGADQIERTETLAAAQNRASNKWTEFVENLNSGQGIISTAGVGFFNLTSQILDLVGAKENLIDKMFKEQLGVNDLINRITALNEDNSDRVKLIDELKTKYPGFIKFIKDEDFSNANLRKTLILVNDEYRNRILLQKQVENLEAAQAKRDNAFKVAASSRLELYNKLNEINSENNLGFNLTVENADQMADKIQSAARKSLSAFDQLRINKLQSDIEGFTKKSEEYNDVVEKEAKNTKKLQEQTGLNTEAQEKQRKQYEKTTATIKELSAEAKKLGLVAGKDFVEYSPSALQEAINNKKRSSSGGGEAEKERKKRGAAERKAQKDAEKDQREAEKRERDNLKSQKEIYEAQIDLLIWRANNKEAVYKSESINEKNSQEERYSALIASQKAEQESLRLNAEKQLNLSRAFQEGKEAFTKEDLNYMLTRKEIVDEVNSLTNEELLILEKFYSEQEKLRKDNQKGLKENVDFEANLLKKQVQEKVTKLTSQNNSDEAGEINALSIGVNLADVENYEKSVYDIKRKYLLKNLEDELAVYNAIIENEKKKGNVTQEMLDNQLKLENEVREFKNESHVISLEKAKEMEQAFIEIGENIKNALVDLTNAIFDSRIEKIDEDIERTNEKYQNEINLAQGNEKVQERLRIKQQADVEKLEAKKRKEQHKQAVFNRAMAIMDIGFSTAMAIMQGYAQLGPVAGSVAAVLIGVLGTIQTAAVLATPIPKYEFGTRGKKHKGGPAELAEKRPEVVLEPGKDPYLISKRGIYDLPKGTEVIPSVDEYSRLQRNIAIMSLAQDKKELNTYQTNDSIFGIQIIDELKQMRGDLKLLGKQKPNVTVKTANNVDFGHELWRLSNLRR